MIGPSLYCLTHRYSEEALPCGEGCGRQRICIRHPLGIPAWMTDANNSFALLVGLSPARNQQC